MLPPFSEPDEDLTALPTLEQVMRLKNGLVARAQSGVFEGGDTAYRTLRRELRRDPVVYAKLPDFVRSCGNLDEFWGFIRSRFPSWLERREFLRESFAPVIEYLEANERSPGLIPVGEMLTQFNAETVHAVWEKALSRRDGDPEGAITIARTLIETVCKHILDDADIAYPDYADLPKLWALTASHLNLAPSQQQEESFKVVLGNCQSIVDRLANLRNTISDAHGRGQRAAKPEVRHAELAVNLAGTMASFLVATWRERGGAVAV